MKKTKENTIDLDKPEDARKFLRGVRIQRKGVEFIELEDGRTLDLATLSDKDAVRYAKDIYLDFCGGAEGEGGYIELETDLQ